MPITPSTTRIVEVTLPYAFTSKVFSKLVTKIAPTNQGNNSNIIAGSTNVQEDESLSSIGLFDYYSQWWLAIGS